jgi:hypothetical protein
MVRRRVILVVPLVAGLGLAACAGSSGRATPAPTQATTTTTVAPTTTTTAPAAADEPVAPDADGFSTRDPFEPQG